MAQKTTDPEVQTTATDKPETPSEPKMTLAQKILAVKNEIGKITRDGEGKVGSEQKGNQKTIRYATLSNVLEKVTPALHKFNVDYVLAPVWSELAVQMMMQGFRFFSIHFVDAESGDTTEPIVYPFRLASNSDAIKADGSTITYVTRYLLGLALGIQTEEDPDQQQQRNQQQQQQRNQQQQQQRNQQPKKVRTFRECVEGFYKVFNEGNIHGAKQTLDFILRNWGNADKFPEYQSDIQLMQTVDLSQKTAAPETETPEPTV